MDEPFGQLDTNTRFQIETRLIEVTVNGAVNVVEAKQVAKTVVGSSLVKMTPAPPHPPCPCRIVFRYSSRSICSSIPFRFA
jgi:ABC-type taurine transport system ATPase subunit